MNISSLSFSHISNESFNNFNLGRFLISDMLDELSLMLSKTTFSNFLFLVRTFLINCRLDNSSFITSFLKLVTEPFFVRKQKSSLLLSHSIDTKSFPVMSTTLLVMRKVSTEVLMEVQVMETLIREAGSTFDKMQFITRWGTFTRCLGKHLSL